MSSGLRQLKGDTVKGRLSVDWYDDVNDAGSNLNFGSFTLQEVTRDSLASRRTITGRRCHLRHCRVLVAAAAALVHLPTHSLP